MFSVGISYKRTRCKWRVTWGVGTIQKPTIKDNSIYKRYLKVNLLDTQTDLEQRISKINDFDYEKYPALAQTIIYEENSNLVYKQELFKIKKVGKLKKEDFFDVADALEYFNTIGFIHGDLNKKNIIYTNDGFKIIDFEPSLYQVKNEIKQYMITVPYVVKEELTNRNLTTLTDKLGFLYFVLRVQKKMSSFDVVKLSKSFDHEQYLKMKYSDIESMSYREILERVYLV